MEERIPKVPFAEARRGLQMLVSDIKLYSHKHASDQPQGIIMRTLSLLQILIIVGVLVGFAYGVLWILTHLMPW